MAQKILLVDDREDNLLSLETILEPGGYELVKARSGREALRLLLHDVDYALILMDVNMPNLNGFETASLIYEREKLRHIPIIFITANQLGEENVFRGYRTGGVDYIFKPVNPELLQAKVGVFIELYKKNHKLMSQEQKLMNVNKSLENEIKERIASENEVRELNQKLLENIERLESANKDLDSFASMASHDLQEPLRKIQTFTDILMHKYCAQLNEESSRYLQSIRASSERMYILIMDLLNFSKVANEKGFPESCDLSQIIEEVIRDLDGRIKEKKAEVRADRLPIIVGIPSLLRSLFTNLIENAIKYSSQERPPLIQVQLLGQPGDGQNRQDQTGGYCRIRIQDNGIGFEQRYAEHIFNMFRRLHSNSEFEGTGIGLAICKKIVEKHNGFISAQSEPGKGSIFTVSLPISAKVPYSMLAEPSLKN